MEPGDLVALPGEGDEPTAYLRVERIDDAPTGRRVEASRVPPRSGPARSIGRSRTAPVPVAPAVAGAPFPVALDLPVDRGEPTVLQYLAVAAEPWPGSLTLWRAEAGGPFAVRGSIDYPACLGLLRAPLKPGPLWRLDRGGRLDVTLRRAGALASIGVPAMLAGGNLFAVVSPSGAVEILSAATAIANGADTFSLSGLLRGLAGSEAAAGAGAPTGSLIVRLDDGAVLPLVDHLDEAGRTFRYRIVPSGLDPADPAAASLVATAGLSALTPLRPVHLRARRVGGDVQLSWIRRARRSADSWDTAEVPLDEPEERYAVTLFSGAGAVRSLTASGPTLTYPAAAETADFGGPQAILDVAVAQIGAVAGSGPLTRAQIPVRA